MAPVLVPDSPTKAPKVTQHLQQGFERQRHSALYGDLPLLNLASTSAIREPALPPTSKSSFLASSAAAHRSAASLNRKSNKTSQQKTFKRNGESDLEKSRALVTAIPGVERDDALRLIETLPIGPKEVTPPKDDPHFLKYEPTSGIALRQRKMPHQEVVAHLEGRYYIPISTLYSIAVPGESDDGDFSIPVEGDWLTMGVIMKRSETLYTKTINVDSNGRRHDIEELEDNDDPSESSRPKKNPSKDIEPTKTLHSRAFIIFTLLDISNPPDKFGQHDGSREIELAVFESESSTLSPGGERTYHGGSSGAYEKLVMASYGALICILNPKVRKEYKGKKNAMMLPRDEYFKQKEHPNRRTSTRYRLNARNGKTVALIGIARDYAQCQEEGCKDMIDRRTKTDTCAYHFGRRLEKTQNGRPQLQSSWRPSNTTNQYSMSDGMAGPKSRKFVMDSLTNEDPSMPGGKLFDLSAHLGRGKEMRAAEEKKQKGRNSQVDQEKEAMSRLRNTAVDIKLESMALAKIRKAKEELAERQGGRKSILSGVDIMSESAGSKVIEATLKAVQERKRQAEIDLDSKCKGRKKVARLEKQVDNTKGAPIPMGSYRASNGDVKVLSDISSKLLSRHAVKPSDLAKPVLLRRKKAKMPPTVRPPPGESFYADESSDEEINTLMQSEAMNSHLLELDKQSLLRGRVLPKSPITDDDDSDSDLEIIPA